MIINGKEKKMMLEKNLIKKISKIIQMVKCQSGARKILKTSKTRKISTKKTGTRKIPIMQNGKKVIMITTETKNQNRTVVSFMI